MKVDRTLSGLRLFLLLFLSCPVSAQQIIFNKVLPPAGKTFGHVTGIVQDKQGYMWFATHRGLYSFDGYHFTSYLNNPLDPFSLAASPLESIYADHNGIIWVGSIGAGLDTLA